MNKEVRNWLIFLAIVVALVVVYSWFFQAVGW